MNEPPEITAALAVLNRALTPVPELAREAIARHRQGSAIDEHYDFSVAPVELRRIVYNSIVKFSRRRLWSRVLR